MGVVAFGDWGTVQAKVIGAVALTLIIIGIWMTTKQEHPEPHLGGNMRAGVITLLISTIGYIEYSFFPNYVSVDE